MAGALGAGAILGRYAVYGNRDGVLFVDQLNRHCNWTYTDLEFLSRYRFEKEVVEDLDNDFWDSGFCGTKTRWARIGQYGSDERLMMMLRYLSSGADFKIIADGESKNSKTTVHRCVWEAVDFVYYNHERYIRWPQTPAELRAKELLYQTDAFMNKPLVVGSADCMHIAIKKPNYMWPEEAFVNRKGYHSINVFLIVDADCNVLHADVKWPGSASDAYIMNSSEVRDFGDRGFFGEHFLVADMGFRQRDYMFTPFYGAPADLTNEQKRYNTWHAKVRSPVERTNGQIKMRFRLLDNSSGVIDHEPDLVSKLIMASVCLHNLANHLRQPDPPEDPYFAHDYFMNHVRDGVVRDQPDQVPVLNQGQNERRNAYVQQFFTM